MPLYLQSTGRSILKTLAAVSADIANAETVVLQYLIPAGSWVVGTTIEIDNLIFTKSGTTDTGTIRVRIGTAGTTADTQIFSSNVLSAANRQWKGSGAIRLESATSVLPSGGANGGLNPGTANGALAAITISSAASNALYISVTIVASSTADTVALAMGGIWMVGRSA